MIRMAGDKMRLKNANWLISIAMLGLAQVVLAGPALAGSSDSASSWDGVWFECEFASRTSPPGDGCAMLDDDGFIFDGDTVTYIKVIDSTEAEACKKQRAGQCFRADAPAITATRNRQGEAEFTPSTIGIRFIGCTQIFHATQLEEYIEAKPDASRCFWAGKKHFYLRRYLGMVRFDG